MSNAIENKVAEFIHLHGVFAGTGGILLAVSGGADSISLLHILRALQAQGHLHGELVCAHINHQLRGPASDADEEFVVELTGRLGLPVITRTVDVRAYAGTQGLSLETAGRQVRLANLAETARDRGCTWVATGHQKNDNAETVIHRLLRGTGFRGLAGIRPVRRLNEDLRLGSPLLCITRDEIVRYLGEHNLPWREDRTNADAAYTRNRIRHGLLPLLQQESQGCLIDELSELAASAERLYDRVRREAEQAWATTVRTSHDEVRVDAPALASQPELLAIELIRQALVSLGCGERDLTERHYKSVLQLAQRHAAAKETSLPGGFTGRYECGVIVLSRRVCHAHRSHRAEAGIGVHGTPYLLNVPGKTSFGDSEIEANILERGDVSLAAITRDKSPFSEYLDWGRVKPPVVIRPRQGGDRFKPLGLGAVKKVGEFLTAARVPREVREKIVVFADQEQIIWVCPVRMAESVKITESTRRILALTVRSTPDHRRCR